MIHLRYIVYKSPNSPDKQVDFWTDDIVHSTYAREHKIAPLNFLSAGYMRPLWGRWIPYEHYQLDGKSARVDKSLVKKEFLKHPEFQTPDLARMITQTFIAEKKLLKALFITAFKEFFSSRARE